MSGFNYAGSQATAQRLLARFGRDITISRRIPGSGPPQNPGPATLITYRATAVILPASKGTVEAFDNRLESGTLIDEKLRYVLMSPKLTRVTAEGSETIIPQSLDLLTFDGHDWTVLGCTPLNPAGVPVLFPMGVKR